MKMNLRASTRKGKNYSYHDFDQAFDKAIKKNKGIAKLNKSKNHKDGIQRKLILKLRKKKPIAKKQLKKTVHQKNIRRLANEQKQVFDAFRHNENGKEEKVLEKIPLNKLQHQVQINERVKLIQISDEDFFANNRRPYFKCKIQDFWILKSQFIRLKNN